MIRKDVDADASDMMTAKVCEILEKELGIPGNAVYVSYWGPAAGAGMAGFFRRVIKIICHLPKRQVKKCQIAK